VKLSASAFFVAKLTTLLAGKNACCAAGKILDAGGLARLELPLRDDDSSPIRIV
jgi:hypothetical protein